MQNDEKEISLRKLKKVIKKGGGKIYVDGCFSKFDKPRLKLGSKRPVFGK